MHTAYPEKSKWDKVQVLGLAQLYIVQVQIPPPQSRTLNPVQNMSKRFSTIKEQMFKWFFLRDDCDILRNLFIEHTCLPMKDPFIQIIFVA